MNEQQLSTNCSFCGKKYARHEPFLPGVTAKNACSICVRCLQNGKSLIESKMQAQLSSLMLEELIQNLPSPKEIHAYLNQYVISQDETKKVLSVAVYSHYKRLSSVLQASLNKKPKEDKGGGNISVVSQQVKKEKLSDKNNFLEDVVLDKSNILLVGPTGCGKTLLASTLAKMVNVPFAIADATTLTEAGYVGDDVENILLRLLQNADYNVRWAEKGIIFLDEIDKIGRKSENASITRDVSGEGVQQALLKIIEGTTATIPLQGGRKHPQSETVAINTKDILFICGGAFHGLEDIVARRLGTSSIGFRQHYGRKAEITSKNTLTSKKKTEILKETTSEDVVQENDAITSDDLTKFGLIPELVGRLPIVCRLDQLDGDALIEVLTKPKNALIRQYEKMLSFENIALEVEESAYTAIVEEVERLKTGARGLRSILEKVMLNIIYNAEAYSGKTVKLTAESIINKGYFAN